VCVSVCVCVCKRSDPPLGILPTRLQMCHQSWNGTNEFVKLLVGLLGETDHPEGPRVAASRGSDSASSDHLQEAQKRKRFVFSIVHLFEWSPIAGP